ncbi:PadR family transcriptional regulator [Paeniglutamicibacter psychrophenolicus]|uniref:PadR family transcriptional regulator PadR n=1 Tax=Paeniglutamicibacter psychrophenolicus TaxID=257454 RepID=A0ABS4W933_9MICC|nr:PadR family transcriptional regulator [Paeniglutamicibacter psychrophenolicus]MBP2372428.1 PadR family transcriptional regulator PadR [Paeniglutamicibacter psychrophenolicus]
MEISQWPSEWLRGVLAAAVLSIVSNEETYGYLIGQRLAEGGLGVVKGGTLYPLLTRLEQDGDVVASWRDGDGGPGRKYYAITPAGQQRLNLLRTDWQIFSGNATSIISGKKAGQ